MSILFGEYELIARSGLFDARYYLEAHPQVAALNVDPLLHYLESGARERLDPSDRFDTRYYLQECRRIGETPDNALLHYLTVGSERGLKIHPRARGATPPPLATGPARQASQPNGHADAATHFLCIDIPQITHGVAEAPVHGGLSIVGWGFGAGGVTRVEIALDGKRVTTARHGLRRPDVAAAHGDRVGSLLSGFAAHLPPKAFAAGRQRVAVVMHFANGAVERAEFDVAVREIADTPGPWALRRQMPQAEVGAKSATLEALAWQPRFLVTLPMPTTPKALAAARATLASLAVQVYPDWTLQLLRAPAPAGRGKSPVARAAGVPTALLAGFEDLAPRVRTSDPAAPTQRAGRATRAARATTAADTGPAFVLRLAPGDTLGCDALLELALASGRERDVDCWYADERRAETPGAKSGAYFKPDWSPDLLLATNYLGRTACASPALLARAGLALGDLAGLGDYDWSLRLTEAAARVGHVSAVLLERSEVIQDGAAVERRALAAALARRQIRAEVEPGAVPGHYRVRRRTRKPRVSIIIPTCAAHEHIQTCIESLRAHTAYEHYEIVCIENIPPSARSWKGWLRSRVDVLIETREPFNWSRFNNLAARRATGEVLLFLNDDTEASAPDWLEALLEHGERPEVGVVGPMLLYQNGSIQQAGVMLDAAGRGRHAFRHLHGENPGYFGQAQTIRNVIGVTGAALMTRRATFDTLGGFDEAHAVINNDLDYCLKALEHGLVNVYTPYARLVHHELGSRAEIAEDYDVVGFAARWRRVLALGDPYVSRHLTLNREHFVIESEPLETLHAGHPVFARESIRRILVVKLDHIGDCLTALPSVRRLKAHFPDAKLTVLAGAATQWLWRLEAAVDDCLEFNFFHARSGHGKVAIADAAAARLRSDLEARRFDLAIDLRKQPDAREVLRWTGARVLAGFDSHGRFPWLDVALEWDEDVPLRTKHGHVSDDLVALVEALWVHGEPARAATLTPPATTPQSFARLPAALRRRLFAKPLICVHPASGSVMRQWPLAKFAALIDLLAAHDDHQVAVIGGPDETEHAAKLLAGVAARERVIDLVGLTASEELPQLLGRAALFVGNNSGPQHLAAALGIPTIGIHSGVVDAREWGPVGPQAIALRRAMSCSPCFIEHAKDCQRGLACLEELAVGAVYRACLAALGQPEPRWNAGAVEAARV